MASSQQPAHRPPYPHQNPTFRSDYGSQNNPRPSPMNQQSPNVMNYSSPSPQSFSPQFGHPPAAKRPRLSEEPQSAFSPPHYPQTPGGQSGSPVGAPPVNGLPSGNRPGLMPPPQRPTDREKEKPENFNDVLLMSGIDIEAESQNLARQDYYSQNSSQPRPGQFQYGNNSLNRPGSSGYGAQPNGYNPQHQPQLPEPTPEEKQQRIEARADWEASRHSQYPLWDSFLLGGNLNEKIRTISQRERLHDPQAGVLVNTQRTGPPPVARVNGFEGATRVIDKGQAILDSGAKGERLREVMSIIALATKTRMTGLVNASARLAIERREHSKGKVPTEWEDVAVRPPTSAEGADTAQPVEASTGMKRTHSQADNEASAVTGTDRITATFQKLVQAERAEEEARRAKQSKRKAAANPDAATTPDVAAMEAAVAAEANQKITKKAQKEIAGRLADKEQHKSANEAARMAVTGLMGNRFGSKKGKTYDWMNAGKSGTSTPHTPSRLPGSATASAVGTPSADRPRPQAKEKRFSAWDEDKDPGIQARDVLLVLETDGRAPKTYLKALNQLEG